MEEGGFTKLEIKFAKESPRDTSEAANQSGFLTFKYQIVHFSNIEMSDMHVCQCQV